MPDSFKASSLRADALAIFHAALPAVDPYRAVRAALVRSGNHLRLRQGGQVILEVDLGTVDRVFLVGAGKATAPMAGAVEDILGPKLITGVISVKSGHGLPLKRIEVVEAGHPLPDLKGLEAARAVVRLLKEADEKTLVISLLSGGGSALLPLPGEGITLEEKQEVTRHLLACGASIHEINWVRKHLSQVKGGQLARLAAPARVINLIVSDVVGDDLDTIASGPFVPDRSTYRDAWAVMAKFSLIDQLPASVKDRLHQGCVGAISETPKPEAPEFHRVTNLIVASNFVALKAAAAEAKTRGYRTAILSSSIEGETREVARVHAAMAREMRNTGHPLKPPACLISGGETTVTIRGSGQGGRNQEFALAACLDLDGLSDVLVFSAGTDGTDGPTDAAGAMADGTSCRRAKESGINPRRHLDNNDAYPFFKALGDLVITGPTRTNVMDVRLVLAG